MPPTLSSIPLSLAHAGLGVVEVRPPPRTGVWSHDERTGSQSESTGTLLPLLASSTAVAVDVCVHFFKDCVSLSLDFGVFKGPATSRRR